MSEMSFERTRQNVGLPPFVADQHGVVRDNGRQIDWDLLGDTFVSNPQIVKLSAAAAPGAVALAVDALPIDLQIGDLLDFGVLEQVVVTASAALAAATAIGCVALTGPIPDNTILDFGGAKFARVNGNVAAGAVSIPVDAIPTALAGGETATFEGGQLIAVVDAAANAGATAVVVEDLPLGIPDNAEAVLPFETGDSTSRGRHVKAGTIVDLLSSGKIVPAGIATAGVTAYGILITNADEFSETDAATGYGVFVSGSFYDNLLPDFANAALATWKTELLARGGFWIFGTYADNTVS